jgi:hypothetical protein
VVLVLQDLDQVMEVTLEVLVVQVEEQEILEVFVHHIQLQQEQAFQVKVIQAVHQIIYTLNMLVEQGVEVLVQQVAMVISVDLNQYFLQAMLYL